METRIEVETPQGPIWFWGRDTGKPIFLMISGAFSNFNVLQGLQKFLPETDVLRSHLPGNHCPELATVSIEAYGDAYSHAIDALPGDRPAMVLGLSTGSLIALAMRGPRLRRLLIVEPPLCNWYLWPFLQFRMGEIEGWEKLLWPIYGIGPTEIEPRDYRPLLKDLTIPTRAVVGDLPLMPERPLEKWPSLVDETSRKALQQAGVEMLVAPGAGHNVPAEAREFFAEEVRRSSREAFG